MLGFSINAMEKDSRKNPRINYRKETLYGASVRFTLRLLYLFLLSLPHADDYNYVEWIEEKK